MKLIFRKDLTAILIVFSLTILGQGCSTPENKIVELGNIYRDLPFSMPEIELLSFPDYQVNICDFGAQSDGVTLNTEAIITLLRQCMIKGEGKLLFRKDYG